MSVSVVIASRRGTENLKQCISSLMFQHTTPEEILVVVDTLEQAIQVKAFIESNHLDAEALVACPPGVAGARNTGILVAKGDIIAFIDDDAMAGNGWVETIEVNISKGCHIVGGPALPMFEGKPISEKYWWIVGCIPDSDFNHRPISCNMAVRKSTLIEAGLFQEVGKKKMKHPMSEETELILRIEQRHPGRSAWDRRMVVGHQVPKDRTTLHYIMHRAYKEGVGKAVIRNSGLKMDTEYKFLKYYVTNPDRYTIPVLASTFLGYVKGRFL